MSKFSGPNWMEECMPELTRNMSQFPHGMRFIETHKDYPWFPECCDTEARDESSSSCDTEEAENSGVCEDCSNYPLEDSCESEDGEELIGAPRVIDSRASYLEESCESEEPLENDRDSCGSTFIESASSSSEEEEHAPYTIHATIWL